MGGSGSRSGMEKVRPCKRGGRGFCMSRIAIYYKMAALDVLSVMRMFGASSQRLCAKIQQQARRPDDDATRTGANR